MQQQRKDKESTMTVAAGKSSKPRPAAIWVAKSELSKATSEPKQAEAGAPPPGDKADPITEEVVVSGEKVAKGGGGGIVGGLTRQVSLSRLNAEAPAFVPKTPTPTSTAPPPVSESPVTAPEPEEQSLSVSAKSSVALGDELRSQIVQQVEFYFSDANLPTDSYLMKFVKKDSEGFVPIPVIASFRKMKQLTKSHAAIAVALRSSSKLVVSEDGKKVRRAEPLSEIDLDDAQARTVVAENLPDDHSIQSLEKLFGTVGTVKMVKVCEAGTTNAGGINAVKASKVDRVVSNKLHALVEYETVEQAEKAVAELTDRQNWRSGLHVRLLLRRMHPTNNKYNNYNIKGKKQHFGDATTGDEESERTTEGEAQSDQPPEAGTEGEKESGVRRGAISVRGRGRGRGRGRVNSSNGGGGTYGSAPQVSCSALTEFISKPPPGPRMPDGTKGFTFGRGKTTPTKPSALVVT